MLERGSTSIQLLPYSSQLPHRSHGEGCKESCKEGCEEEMTGNVEGSREEQAAERLISVAENACDNASKQYDDYYKGFSAQDGKAQNAATVSGIVLAAVVALANGGRFRILFSGSCPCAFLLVLVPPLGALITIVLSLMATRLMAITVPFDIAGQIEEADDLNKIARDQLSADHIISYYFAQLDHWKEAIKDIEEKAAKKAKWLFAAQLVLVFTVLMFVLLFVISIKNT